MKLNLVPARTGMTWVREGLRIFWRMPLAFAGLFLMFAVAVTVLSVIPLAGPLLAAALVPAVTAGFMAATRQAEQGRFPLPATLLAAFGQSRRQTRAILLLGAVHVVALLVIGLILAALVDDSQLARLTELFQLIEQNGGKITPELTIGNPVWHEAMRVLRRLMALGGLLYLPVSAMLWHAPALVLWHDLPVGKSLFFSAVAVLRNAPAYLVYGLGWLAVASIAWAGLLIVASMTGNPPQMAVSGTPPLGALVMSMFYTSLWLTFRDSFTPDSPPAK